MELVEQLTKKIAEKAGISEEQAKLAAETAIEHLHERVAHAIEHKVDAAVKLMAWTVKSEVHEAVTGEPPATLAKKIGDFAEGTQEKMGEMAEEAQKKFSELAKNAQGFFGWGKEEKKDDKTK